MRFAKSTGCFYPEEIDYPQLPEDIITVSNEDYQLAMGRDVRESFDLVEGRIVIVPPILPTKNEVLDIKWIQIKAERDTRKCGGVLVRGKWFHSDADSRIQFIALKDPDSIIPTDLSWKTMDGTWYPMDKLLALEIFNNLVVLDFRLFQKGEQKFTEASAMEDPTEYDIKSGWPVQYTDLVK